VVVTCSGLQAARAAALAGLVAFGVATIAVIHAAAPWGTTYSGSSSVAAAADFAAGFGLIAAGLLAASGSSSRRSGLLAVLAGAAWLSRDWIGWQDGAPFARTIAMAVLPFLAPLLLGLVVAFPEGGLRSRSARAVVLAGYLAVGVVTAGWLATDDVRRDRECWNNCTDNVFLITAHPAAAHWLGRAGLLLELGLGLGLVVGCVLRMCRATAPARRVLAPVMVTGSVAGASLAAHAGARLHHPLEGPQFGASSVIFQTMAWSLAAVALGLAWAAVRARRVRAAVAGLVSDLGEAAGPASLSSMLVGATGDAGLEVGYWLADRGRFVDAAGQPMPAVAQAGNQAVTLIVRNDQLVAAVRHDPTLVSAQHLKQAIGAGARLALDNERLRAQLLADIAELRMSRARIVEAGDAERRRLERNLHDGAQQRLLALSYDLRVLGTAIAADAELQGLLDDAAAEIRSASAQLRDLARGIYPAVLTESGLAAALATFADTAPIAVKLEALPAERFAAQTERAVYVVIAEAVGHACRSGAHHVNVCVSQTQDRVRVDIDRGGPGAQPYLADRLGAIGGHLVMAGDSLRAEIPCA
jgi:signal transduction histidine kinase